MAAARGFERGANLDRVVAVVVDQRDAVDDALDLEAPAHAGEILQARANQIRRDIEIERDGGGGGGIAHVVNARRAGQMKFAEVVAAIGQPEAAGEPLQLDVADDQVGLARSAVGDDRALDARDDGLHVGLVQAKHGGAIKRHAIDELRENVLNLLERGVVIEMLAIDGGHHGDHRREQQKCAVAFVGFDDHVFAAAQAGRGADLIHAAAHDKGGIEPGRGRGPTAIIEVVVVLPCAPATAMPYFRRINSASISARGMTGIFRRAASASSGLSRRDRRGGDHDVRAVDLFGAVAFVDLRRRDFPGAR